MASLLAALIASLIALLSIACADPPSTATSPPVRVSLQSSWDSPPFLLLALESLHQTHPPALFPALDTLDPSLSPAAQHALLRERLPEPQRALFDINLALGASAPAVQAAWEVYRQEGWDVRDGCESWAEWDGKRLCSVEELEEAEKGGWKREISLTPHRLLPIDYSSTPSPSADLPTLIHHASPTSPSFGPLHSWISSRSPSTLHYVLRWAPSSPSQGGNAKQQLAGWGAELDLKKRDYIVVDDRALRDEGARFEEAGEKVVQEDSPSDADLPAFLHLGPSPSLDTLDPTLIPTLGPRLITLLTNSSLTPHPLRTLRALTQDLPLYAGRLLSPSAPSPSPEVEHDLALNFEEYLRPGQSAVWLNGARVPESDFTAFGLLRLLPPELELLAALQDLRLTRAQARKLLTHPALAAAASASASSSGDAQGIFDASDRPEGARVIRWLNDLERDRQYSGRGWQRSLQALLRPSFPPMSGPPRVARNTINVVLVLDLARADSAALLSGTVRALVQRGIGVRWGVAPFVGEQEGENSHGAQAAKVFYHLMDNYGRDVAFEFFSELARHRAPFQHAARTAFTQLLSNINMDEKQPPPSTWEEVVSSPGADELLEKDRAYAGRLGVGVDAEGAGKDKDGFVGEAFVNGRAVKVDEEFLPALQELLNSQMQLITQLVYQEVLHDDMDVSTYFYDLPTTSARRNPHLERRPLRIVSVPEAFGERELVGRTFVWPEGEEKVDTTLWVVADFDSAEGIELVTEAAKAMLAQPNFRLSFISNPSPPTSPHPPHKLSRVLSSIPRRPAASPAELLALIVSGVEEDHEAHALPSRDADREAVRRLGLAEGEAGVVVNGRIIGPLPRKAVTAEDIEHLIKRERAQRIVPVVEALQEVVPNLADLERSEHAAFISDVGSTLWAAAQASADQDAPASPRSRIWDRLYSNHTSIAMGDKDTALYHFDVILDPVSELGQKWAQLLKVIEDTGDAYIRVLFNPDTTQDKLPVNRFYRLNMDSQPRFDENGELITRSLEFKRMPSDALFTLEVDPPSSWLVRPRASSVDLDNLHLGALAQSRRLPSVEATYELAHLVVDGHARDTLTGQPPRGLQLILDGGANRTTSDTLVVANLGYLQLRANPGRWTLAIRSGRGREVYEMESAGALGFGSRSVEEAGADVFVTTFDGVTLYPRFRRKKGMERADVLDEPPPKQPGLFDQVKWRINGLLGKEESGLAVKNADINIFTVASGLLYERFASIMILSVLRHTNHTVKFWFIENFLSPSFIEFLPHFAEEYGFQYELVTYKWPSWLRAQKEKQRTIWAYKILFLDVLFPMSLDKVIFVDADNIVRTDLKELVDLDLHGTVYGYPPMGMSRTEMDGYRFWTTGYWKDYLRGRPYHISALYVVDLKRFRQRAAGDRLRGQYQALSADPNSLANLDQDLPNNFQSEVPIFTLDESWLWCETWNSDESLAAAKTIDLCNNPMTKEPKLDRARKIPEWTLYDEEIKAFSARIAAEKGGVIVADADQLAKGPGVPVILGGGGAGQDTGVQTAEKDEVVEQDAQGHEEHLRDEL